MHFFSMNQSLCLHCCNSNGLPELYNCLLIYMWLNWLYSTRKNKAVFVFECEVYYNDRVSDWVSEPHAINLGPYWLEL